MRIATIAMKTAAMAPVARGAESGRDLGRTLRANGVFVEKAGTTEGGGRARAGRSRPYSGGRGGGGARRRRSGEEKSTAAGNASADVGRGGRARGRGSSGISGRRVGEGREKTADGA